MGVTQRLAIDNEQLGREVIRLQKNAIGPVTLFNQPAPIAKTTTTTLTAAELMNGLITGNPGTTATYTLPTGALMDAAMLVANPDLAVDDAFDFAIVNIDTTIGDIITVAAGTSFTVVGDMTLTGAAAGDTSSGTFRARRSAAGVWVLYRLT